MPNRSSVEQTRLIARPLTPEAFAPFGDVLEADGAFDRLINAGKCVRYHDRAQLDFSDGRPGLSLFEAEPCTLPYELDLLERHPLGSQAFMPLSAQAFLVIVAEDQGKVPGRPEVFVTAPGRAINLHRGIWHGVLTPLGGSGLFAVLDRIGPGDNLEEFPLPAPYVILAPQLDQA